MLELSPSGFNFLKEIYFSLRASEGNAPTSLQSLLQRKSHNQTQMQLSPFQVGA